MRNRGIAVTFLSLALVVACMGSLEGQQTQLTAIRGVSFGIVLPGVPFHVLRTDPVNSGQFQLKAPPPKIVTYTFTLPTVLNGPLGATMPISFATNDAGYSGTNVITSQVAFDPHIPFTSSMVTNRVGIFLGGTVSPIPTQRAGSYTATVVLSVLVL